ncbi:hypothetical protein DAMA08_049950 [Martiniozyma asiatica (nom. inval.)]|nr:hypothetical protein DAMA08_049950 [Martiniozyma asiatica]
MEKTADIKAVLLGESAVGKSSLVERLNGNGFSETKGSTIGAAFISKSVVRNSRRINLHLWDTAGQERFHNLTPLYYRNAHTAIVVFDLSSPQSFKKAGYWIDELFNYNGGENQQLQILLVGNKLDLLGLKDEVEPVDSVYTEDMYNECEFISEVKAFMKQHDKYLVPKLFKTSAKHNVGIFELFDYIINNVKDEMFVSSGDELNKKDHVDLSFKTRVTNGCQC